MFIKLKGRLGTLKERKGYGTVIGRSERLKMLKDALERPLIKRSLGDARGTVFEKTGTGRSRSRHINVSFLPYR